MRQLLPTLLLGVLLTAACAWLGDLLTPAAIARWTIQTNEQDEWRAALALVGIRHLPVFLLAVAFGNGLFAALRSTSTPALVCAAVPYLLYVVGSGIEESLAAGERAFEWMAYDPAYFIWPHFLTVPCGLMAARSMVRRRVEQQP